MPLIATASATGFHLGLYVAQLEPAVRFYRVLFGVELVKNLDDYVKFELDRPPLVLTLHPSPQSTGGPLNHVGFRLESAEALVAVQRRLEEAGIATQRQEGVECCYARQTKFWVIDPDSTMWEIYTLHEDIDHSGFDDPPPSAKRSAQAVWAHRLTDAVPVRVPHADGELDEVRLEGTFNAAVTTATLTAFLAEVFRVLKTGGKISVHGLVGDKPFPGTPKLPGLASLVQRVPLEAEAAQALEITGFRDLFYDRLGDIHCFQVGGVELREMRLSGTKPPSPGKSEVCPVIYKGPFEEVIDDEGTVFRRGERVLVPAAQVERLRRGPAAEQFAILAR